jgi:tetratricopeptide (TPR) repeat protein
MPRRIRASFPGFFATLSLGLAFAFLAGCTQKVERIKNARKYMSQWNYDRALTELISYRESPDPEIQYILGSCYLRKNEYDEAARYFGKSLKTDSTYRDSILKIYTTLAKNALAINDLPRALRHYQDLARLIPDYNQANNLFVIGDLNYNQGNFYSAMEAYLKALEIDSLSKRARGILPKLIKCLVENDSLDRALRTATREYEKLKVAENLLIMSEIKFTIGQKLLQVAAYDSAKTYFRSIIDQQEPKSLLDDSYFYLGEIYLKTDSAAAALEAYKKVLRLNPYQKGDIVKKAQDRINEIKGTKGT